MISVSVGGQMSFPPPLPPLLKHTHTHTHTHAYTSGWLSPNDDPLGYVSRIDQRIEDITGLAMSTAEQLQVVNYGIGGHYEPHYDFAQVFHVIFMQ